MSEGIGKRMEELLDTRPGMRAEIMRAADVTQGAISHWKSRGSLSLKPALDIAQELGISLDWLFLGRGRMYQPVPLEELCPGADSGKTQELAIKLVKSITKRPPDETTYTDEDGKVHRSYAVSAPPDQLRSLHEIWRYRDSLVKA